jgi:hypothetical protein
VVHGGLQVIQVHAALAEPLLQRGEGGVGKQLGHAREWAFSVVHQGQDILFANLTELKEIETEVAVVSPSPFLDHPAPPVADF